MVFILTPLDTAWECGCPPPLLWIVPGHNADCFQFGWPAQSQSGAGDTGWSLRTGLQDYPLAFLRQCLPCGAIGEETEGTAVGTGNIWAAALLQWSPL